MLYLGAPSDRALPHTADPARYKIHAFLSVGHGNEMPAVYYFTCIWRDRNDPIESPMYSRRLENCVIQSRPFKNCLAHGADKFGLAAIKHLGNLVWNFSGNHLDKFNRQQVRERMNQRQEIINLFFFLRAPNQEKMA